MKWIKKRVFDGEILAGMFLNLGAGCVAQMAGRAGLDWVLIDTEHGLGDYNTLVEYLLSAKIGNITPIVRVIANECEHFKKALDLGAAGIMVPQVNNAQEARKAVSFMKYPPQGVRGLTRSSRAGAFGYDAKQYLEEVNDSLLAVIQIETKDAIDNVEEIAAVDGVDVLFVGPSDLSCNLQVPCDLGSPQLKSAVDKVRRAAAKYEKKTGILIKDATQLPSIVQDGFTLIALETDMTLLKTAIKNVAESFETHRGKVNKEGR